MPPDVVADEPAEVVFLTSPSASFLGSWIGLLQVTSTNPDQQKGPVGVSLKVDQTWAVHKVGFGKASFLDALSKKKKSLGLQFMRPIVQRKDV